MKGLTKGFAVPSETPGHKQAAHFLSCLETPFEQLPHMECEVGMQVESCRAIEMEAQRTDVL